MIGGPLTGVLKSAFLVPVISSYKWDSTRSPESQVSCSWRPENWTKIEN